MSVPILPIRDAGAIALAATLIKAGELVIIPTETIYGIVTLLDNEETIARLYEVRRREPEPARPVLISTVKYLRQIAVPNNTALQLAYHLWPGPLTLILPPVKNITPVALRVPNFPLLQPLFNLVGGCLFASGAILPGHSPAITAQEAAALFGQHMALILDSGPAPYGVPSTILDCTRHPPLLVRRGATSEDKIRDILGDIPLATV